MYSMMEPVKKYRDTGLLMNLYAVSNCIEPFIVFNYEPFTNLFIEIVIIPDEPFYTFCLIAIHPPYMHLNLGGAIEIEQFKEPDMILQFIDAPRENIRIGGVKQDELIRVQGYPEPVLSYKFTKSLELIPEIFPPGIRADRVRGKGNHI